MYRKFISIIGQLNKQELENLSNYTKLPITNNLNNMEMKIIDAIIDNTPITIDISSNDNVSIFKKQIPINLMIPTSVYKNSIILEKVVVDKNGYLKLFYYVELNSVRQFKDYQLFGSDLDGDDDNIKDEVSIVRQNDANYLIETKSKIICNGLDLYKKENLKLFKEIDNKINLLKEDLNNFEITEDIPEVTRIKLSYHKSKIKDQIDNLYKEKYDFLIKKLEKDAKIINEFCNGIIILNDIDYAIYEKIYKYGILMDKDEIYTSNSIFGLLINILVQKYNYKIKISDVDTDIHIFN